MEQTDSGDPFLLEPVERKAAAIMVYIPDQDQLPKWLNMFRAVGFVEVDWCELRRQKDDVRVSYGPCERLPEDGLSCDL